MRNHIIAAIGSAILSASILTPLTATAFQARQVSALDCQRIAGTPALRLEPPYWYSNSDLTGGAVACPIPDSSELPTTAVTLMSVYVNDAEWGTSNSDKEFTVKVCYNNGLFSGGCGTATSSLGTGQFTLQPSISQLSNTGASGAYSYLYVDYPAHVDPVGPRSLMTGFSVYYP